MRKATKTQASQRILPLPSWIVDLLRVRAPNSTNTLDMPVFCDTLGGYRDPSNTLRALREAKGEEFSWLTSHSIRKTTATILDEAGLSARSIADQLGHSRPSLTQDVYMGRKISDPRRAVALETLWGESDERHE